MNVKNPFTIKCNNCGKIADIRVDIKCVSSYNRRLGDELEYSGVYNGCCPFCSSDITVEIDAWEYPHGHLDQFIINTQGGSYLDNPRFCFD